MCKIKLFAGNQVYVRYVFIQRENLENESLSNLKTLFFRKSRLKKDEVGIVSGLNDAHEVIRGFMHVK